MSGWPGGGWFKRGPDHVDIDGTSSPWLYRSGYRGVRRCEVPLFPPADGRALYTVRLGFAELENEKPGERVFGIKLNNKTVLQDFDPFQEAGGPRKAVVKEFTGIAGAEKLRIELVPKVAKPTPAQTPVLQTIEIVRERVLALGFSAPSFLLNNAEPEQTGDVRVANHKDQEFKGTLRVGAPEGFAVTPAETSVKLAPGTNATVALKAALVKQAPKGEYPVTLKLVRSDGGIECERQTRIEHLAEGGRVVLNPVADAHCQQSFAARNVGGDPAMNVDGGHAKLGDHHHSVAYLTFRIDVPGKPTSLTLRLYNAGNPTGDSGRICLATEAWDEKKMTYASRPKAGQELVKLGPVHANQTLQLPLKLDVAGQSELRLMIDPTGCDGVNYYSREGAKPPELVVEYRQ